MILIPPLGGLPEATRSTGGVSLCHLGIFNAIKNTMFCVSLDSHAFFSALQYYFVIPVYTAFYSRPN